MDPDLHVITKLGLNFSLGISTLQSCLIDTDKMANRVQIRTTFAPAKVIQPLYTRGSVALSQDGRILASCLDDDVLLTDLRTGEELARIEGVRHYF